jgi:hypothetical protein
MQQGRFRATGTMIHHPHPFNRSSIATLIYRSGESILESRPGSILESAEAPAIPKLLNALLGTRETLSKRDAKRTIKILHRLGTKLG